MASVTATLGVIIIALPAGIFISEFMRISSKKRDRRDDMHPHKSVKADLDGDLNRALGRAFHLWHQLSSKEKPVGH